MSQRERKREKKCVKTNLRHKKFETILTLKRVFFRILPETKLNENRIFAIKATISMVLF